MKKKRLVPELRFSEFNDDWEIKRLHQISTAVKEKNKNNEINTVFSNSAKFGIVLQEDFFDKDIANKTNINRYYIVKPNDFVYNPRISNSAPVGPIKQNETGLTGIVSPLYSIFRVSSNVNSKYLKHFFSSEKWYRYIKGVANYGARHDRINITQRDLYNMPITIPSIKEQERIATFLSIMDYKIDLLEKKYQSYQNFKMYLMQQIFTQKLRFDFEEPWQDIKLAELTEKISSGKTNFKKSNAEHGKYPIYGSRGIIGYMASYDYYDNYLLIARVGANAGSLFKISGKCGITDNTLILKTNDLINDDFLFYYLKNYNLNRLVFGSGQPLITGNQLKNIKIDLPSIDEQKKISEVFIKVDANINLLNNSIESFLKFKNGLLQQMFV